MSKEEAQTFSALIEKLMRDKNISCVDAIIYHCEKTGFEVELVAKLLTSSLKEKIKKEATVLNFLKKKKGKR